MEKAKDSTKEKERVEREAQLTILEEELRLIKQNEEKVQNKIKMNKS